MPHGAGIFTNIGSKNYPNVGKYTIHGADGICNSMYLNVFHLVIEVRLHCTRTVLKAPIVSNHENGKRNQIEYCVINKI